MKAIRHTSPEEEIDVVITGIRLAYFDKNPPRKWEIDPVMSTNISPCPEIIFSDLSEYGLDYWEKITMGGYDWTVVSESRAFCSDMTYEDGLKWYEKILAAS